MPVPPLKYTRKSASILEIDAGGAAIVEAHGTTTDIDRLMEALEARDIALWEWDEWRSTEVMDATRCALMAAIKARFPAKEAERLIEMLRGLP